MTVTKLQVKNLKGLKRGQDIQLMPKTYVNVKKKMDSEIKEPADP